MFWSGNYIVVRELNFLLKEENVSLSQVLEADDILQECKADNKALIQFLTKPEILAELITLITEEPPKNVELASQYRHANIACEVLTSHLSMLSDRLSLDVVQMNRLCDFVSKDPPLNPLLASYFSKTVEMLLERSPKQDWYLYHIVCLRVLDFFKSRRDFLPNLLRHISTSAIADTFKYFIRLDDLFNKIVMEWLDEHQFLESLIQIICGTYMPEDVPPAPRAQGDERVEPPGVGIQDDPDLNHTETKDSEEDGKDPEKPEESTENPPETNCNSHKNDNHMDSEAIRARDEARTAAIASANAAALLCDLILNGCAPEGCSTRPRTSWVLAARLQAEVGVRALLQGMFTSCARARRAAIVNGCHVLRALLDHNPILANECDTERTSVELAVAPHLPLLHHALLHDPELYLHNTDPEAPQDKNKESENSDTRGGRVGLARVQVAALLAHLAVSEVEEVPTTMLTLGTPGVLVDMFFAYPHNNFLHAEVYALVKHALENRAYRTQYARHLLVECDLLTRLMDAFEENEKKTSSSARSGYMGYVVLALQRVARALDAADGELAPLLAPRPDLQQRWTAFLEDKLRPLIKQHDTPLGGSYPSENIYEAENMADTLAANYAFNDISATATMDNMADEMNEMCGSSGPLDTPHFIADGLGLEDEDRMAAVKNHFLELANQRFDDDMWDDTPEPEQDEIEAESRTRVHDVLGEVSPWEASAEDGFSSAGAGEGWAQFDAFPSAPSAPTGPPAPPGPAPATPPSADPFAAAAPPTGFGPEAQFSPFWAYGGEQDNDTDSSTTNLEANMRNLHLTNDPRDRTIDDPSTVELANNLLTAMSAMTPDAIANIVNANMTPAFDVKDTLEVTDRQEITDRQDVTDVQEVKDDKDTAER